MNVVEFKSLMADLKKSENSLVKIHNKRQKLDKKADKALAKFCFTTSLGATQIKDKKQQEEFESALKELDSKIKQ